MVIKDLTAPELTAFYQAFSAIMDEGYNNFPEYLKKYFMETLYPYNNFQFWLSRNIRKILITVDESNNSLAGFVVGDHTYGGVGFISWLGVLPQYRKQGLATQMLAEYEKYVLARKGFALELFTFDHLLPFYNSLGFKEIGRRDPGYFGQKNIIMTKQLGEWIPEYLQMPAVN
ncbi:MAG: GNAT family N-acetyltransferase [bacterium]